MRIFVSTPAGEYYEVDYIDYAFTRRRDTDKGDGFAFVTRDDISIIPGAWVRVERSGHTVYRGAALYSSGGYGAPITWACESIQDILRQRFSYPMRWGAPAIVEGFEALTISQVISDGPPSQAAGVDQYVPGLIWMAQSYLSITPAEIDEDGVHIYRGWGLKSRAGTKDIYVGGRKCTEADLADVGSQEFSFYRDDDDLYIFGVGGRDFGPYCIDGAFDYGIRIGDIDRIDDYMLTALDSQMENYWQILYDFLVAQGLHVRLRHQDDLTYLDASISPYARGSQDGGGYNMGIDAWSKMKRSRPRDIPPSALLGLGDGDGLTQVRYSVADPTKRGPWVEAVETVSGEQLSPMGQLDPIIDAQWADLSHEEYFEIETHLDFFRPGDWLNLSASPSEVFTTQIFEISETSRGLFTLKTGGKHASPEYAFESKRESLAVAYLRKGQEFSTADASDFLGESTPLSLSWTPDDSVDRDIEKVTLSLSCDDPDAAAETSLAVTYTIKIFNTLYPAPDGKIIAVIRHAPWATDPIFSGLDITEWCAIDGTQETIQISVSDPWGVLSEDLMCTASVSGIGRRFQTPKGTMYIASTSSSTLDGEYYILVDQVSSIGVGARGTCQVFVRVGGTNYYGPTQHLNLEIAFDKRTGKWEQVWEKNPATDAPWSQEDLDNLQCGVVLSVTNHAKDTAQGSAILNMTNLTRPTYGVKLVVAYSASLSAIHSVGDKLATTLTDLRAEIR